ncbi:MAG TPA: preprotein translocase subunit SecA [Polyangiales bacterium]|nr:preprotein translocase subunit SecA [Polyangiales bacterium]
MFQFALKKVFGTKHEREIKRLRPMVEAINSRETAMAALSDDQLKAKTAEFKQQLANGATLEDLKFDAFAALREASKRALGMRHYDVQLIGGMVLHEGKIAEMKTGEGKTLVATLPCYLNALEGKGVHVVTVNDYLAKRDAEWMGRLYNWMGLSWGVVVPQQRDAAKKRAYRSDITYGQNNEFGFDYLRDNMKFSIYDYAQRPLNFAIVDEVDSILVDEARTPLIISGPGETASEKYSVISEIVPKLRKDEHYVVDEKAHQVTLTEDGIVQSQKLLMQRGVTQVENLYEPVNLESLHILNQSMRAHTLYKRDQQYMVTTDGKVVIIDEFTGRTLSGRRWSEGLHQAIEAKEHVPIQDESRTLATISFQNLFRLYKKLSGMTGTADTEASEFQKIYSLDVVVIPTNRDITRKDSEDLVYKTEREKFKAVVKDIEECRTRGQPTLVGTTSVEKSEALSRMLEKKGIPHNVLSAKQHEREAYVVAQAGRKGAVTVATNMAGRGTDILLGGNAEMIARYEVLQGADEALRADADALEARVQEETLRYKAQCESEKKEVLAAGGLHILGTERHESRRIDNQLRGRAGRQGDPGSSRFFLSLEDDLMRIFAGERVQLLMDRLGMEEDVPIEHPWVTRAVENAQKKVEERNFDIRKHLLEYDDVMNQQRKSIYALRRQVLEGHYQSVPTEDELKRGVKPELLAKDGPSPELLEHVRPTLKDMVRVHGAVLPPDDAQPEQIAAYRERVMKMELAELGELRVEPLERDIYTWFGCVVSLDDVKKDPAKAYERIEREVALAMTEQQERLLDVLDEIIGFMVERACPPKKHWEDWDTKGLITAYQEQFGLKADEKVTRQTDSLEIATLLYTEAEAALKKKEQDFSSTQFLRLFRTLFLQEIDKQWLEHLGHMDHLRDGIGLRGYGQRDPKKEYKREGYDLFVQTLQNTKASVVEKLFGVQRLTEREVAEAEAQRRRQVEARQRAIQAEHPGEAPAAPQAPVQEQAPAQPQRVMIAARHSAMAQQAALQAQARRLLAMQGGQQAPQQQAPRQAAAQPANAAAQIADMQVRARQAGEAAARARAAQQVPQLRREAPKIGRNDPCHCGSGKKYKNCHMKEDLAATGG